MKIKDGYISFTEKNGLQSFEEFGGFYLTGNRPKQISFTRAEMEKRVSQLILEGCKIGIAEICTYEVENSEHAELIDPIKRVCL